MLHPGALRGVTAVDRAAMTVTVRAGTRLHELNTALERLGLALHNIGDVDVQTLAGAISTGTHGTGGLVASLSALVRGVEVVDGLGALRRVDADHEPDLLPALQLGLDALGVLVSVTLALEPLLTLQAHERTLRWGEAVATFDELVEQHDHAELYWFPHTDRLLAKLDDRSDEPPAPLSRRREWFEDVLLANRVFADMQALGNRFPRLVPPLNGVAVRAVGERSFRDVSHKVFTSSRQVRFRETEHTRCPAPPAWPRSPTCAVSSSGRVGGSAFRSRCAARLPTTPCSPPPPPATRSGSPATSMPRPTTRRTSRPWST